MKILLINNFHFKKGGSESVYFNTAKLLQENGHDVIFFSTIDEKNATNRYEKYFVRQNSSLPKIIGIVNYFYNLEAKSKLKQLIIDEKPDIAHIHLFWGGISPSIFSVLKGYKIPIVHTAHDYRIICPAYTFRDYKGNICEKCKGKHFYKCLINKCSKGHLFQSLLMSIEMYLRNYFFNPSENINGIIYVSEFSKQKHINLFPNLKKIKNEVIYNFTKQEEEFLFKNKKGYFLFYGRLSQEKGIETLVKAFSQRPQEKLIIIGTGPIEEEIKKQLNKNQIKNIELIGYLSGKSLKKYISEAFFVIVPSECYENNPMTIVEAYSMGIPVIGSNIGGIPEIVVQNKTGFIFDYKNTHSLLVQIDSSINLTNDEYRKMSYNALTFYKKNFNEKQYLDRLIRFYNNIIK